MYLQVTKIAEFILLVIILNENDRLDLIEETIGTILLEDDEYVTMGSIGWTGPASTLDSLTLYC